MGKRKKTTKRSQSVDAKENAHFSRAMSRKKKAKERATLSLREGNENLH